MSSIYQLPPAPLMSHDEVDVSVADLLEMIGEIQNGDVVCFGYFKVTREGLESYRAGIEGDPAKAWLAVQMLREEVKDAIWEVYGL